MSETPATTTAAETPPYRYSAELASHIELRWQDFWEANGTFHAPNPSGPMGEPDKIQGREKLFILDMFPYPSGAGLHVGHPLGYIATDVFARYKRMAGFNVLHALGYDAFGLPAEQHAINTGTHPRVNTEQNITNYRRQIRRLGLGHDDRRSVATTDESFYKFTQWIFLQVFNSFFDDDLKVARPIHELIHEFATGVRATPTGSPWATLTDVDQRTIIDSHRLAYVGHAPVNWCPGLGTILSNEEVTADNKSDIGNFPVFKRNMRQWMMRITKYADRLVDDLDRLDWPESIKLMQRNWIGRSEGARVYFASAVGDIEVFTTRPDTLFGATFMVLAPEHPLVDSLTTPTQQKAVAAYRATAAEAQDFERQSDARTKTGVFTGGFATNPVTGTSVPVWVADYVLMGYGTGAIMAVPSGDQRDFEFARQFDLPIVATQMPPDAWFAEREIAPSVDCSTWPEAFVGEGSYVNSANDTLDLNGDRAMADAKTLTNGWLAAQHRGYGTTNYKLRDWLFSRQRYWGEPFPILFDDTGMPVAVPEAMLPVLLPEVDDYRPTAIAADDEVTEPIPPLARRPEWVNVTLDLGDGPKAYRREINVMPQWAGSCWYELRYLDPTNATAFVDPDVERYWMGPRTADATGGVDLYVGGVEHAVLHLLYSRFWHKVLFDLGHVSSQEPFHRLFNQGYIQAFAYRDDRGQPVEASDVIERDGAYFYNGSPVEREYGKMGKSLKNIVTPDEMCDNYGADTFRLYEMAMGPLDASRPWNTRDVIGMQRFLQRLWRLYVDEHTSATVVHNEPSSQATLKAVARTIDGVRRDFEGMRFNTAISKLIELVNHLTGLGGGVNQQIGESLAQMLSPLAPHAAEELWSRLGHDRSITFEPYPYADPALLVDDEIEIAVQVNGKVRSRIMVPAGLDAAGLESFGLANDDVRLLIDGKTIVKVVAVPGRLVNIIVS